MKGGIDYSLMTLTEIKIEGENSSKHDKYVRKRADELGFYPDTLTDDERIATLKCLSYEELKPFYKAVALYEKNQRLQKSLSSIDKIDVRIYAAITRHFSEYGPAFRADLEDGDIGVFTSRYFEIMKEQGEKVYEESLYFLSEERKKRVLEAYAKISSESDEFGLDLTKL
jgi:hypothetical protein